MEPSVKSVGADINWVAFGAVSPVKDQGSCYSNYAFSAVGGIEGISVIYFKNQV
jgi:C1A family cysteine protease